MNIEVIEFYSEHEDQEKRMLKGTLHVYIVDYGIDIRSILVSKSKNFWFFGLPQRFGIDKDTKAKVTYPIFSFVDREKNDDLKQLIFKEGKAYIERNFFTVENRV